MRSSLLEDTFPDVVSSSLMERLTSPTNDFTQLVGILDLDPKSDFRHADLAGVDFSGSDLKGYDFTGADLRGSFGVAVSMDGVILANADTAGSLFEYRQGRDAYFDANPAATKLLRTLSLEHWTKATLWVVDEVGRRRSEESIEVAKALFLDTKDAVLRNQILFFLAKAFDDRPAYMAFLLETLASHGSNVAVRRAVIRLAGRLFYNQRAVHEIMIRELRDARPTDPKEVLVALARSKHTRADLEAVSTIVRGEVDSANRRFFVRAFVGSRGSEFAPLLHDPTLAHALDFDASLSDSMIRSAARTSVSKTSRFSGADADEARERAIDRRADQIRLRLGELDLAGVRLTIEPASVRERKPSLKRKNDTFKVPEGRRILEG